MSDIQLIHGDCLEVLKGIPDKSIDLILTDPPYGISEAAGKNNSRGTKNTPATKFISKNWDNKRIEKIYFDEIFRVSKNQIIFGGNYYVDYLFPSMGWIVWDKLNNGDFSDCELAWTSFNRALRKIEFMWNGFVQGDMKNKEIRIHPTQKPVSVIKQILSLYSTDGQTVLDPFMGGGTTGIACKLLGRNFIGIEIERDYFEMATMRINETIPNRKLFTDSEMTKPEAAMQQMLDFEGDAR